MWSRYSPRPRPVRAGREKLLANGAQDTFDRRSVIVTRTDYAEILPAGRPDVSSGRKEVGGVDTVPRQRGIDCPTLGTAVGQLHYVYYPLTGGSTLAVDPRARPAVSPGADRAGQSWAGSV